MDQPVPTALLLVAGLSLAVIAQWRGWRPSLRIALAVGIALRLALLWLSAADSWQPVDYWDSFRPAAEAILHHQDPILSTGGRWRFLPMIPYAYAVPMAMGIPWVVSGRLITIAADVVLIVLVGKLATGTRRPAPDGADDARQALARFQYACSPIALMISVIHAQVEPVSLVFLVGAYLAARSGRGLAAGALFGLALSAKSWPIILLPVVLSMLPTWRKRAEAFVLAGTVPLLFLLSLPLGAGTHWSQLYEIFRTLGWVRPIVGEWGWTALLTGGNWELVPAYASIGQLLIYGSLIVVAAVWWRADRVDLTLAMLLVFMVVTPRMGAQYLLWFVPFLVARPTRFGQVAMATGAIWAGLGYIYLTQFDDTGWWINHRWWAMSSVLVIPWLVAAMPWDRRKAKPEVPATPATPTPDLVTAR